MPAATPADTALEPLTEAIDAVADRSVFLGIPDALLWLSLAIVLIGALLLLNWLLLLRGNPDRRQLTRRRLVMLGCTIVAVLAAVLSLPIEIGARIQFMQVIALGVTALLTLSSTTITANFLAGLMLGRVRSFKPGDFVRVGEQFGRVSERGLFHVEIQTEDRDLVTLPNAYMITQPVRVVRESGTIVSCELSLGYDVDHGEIDPLLKRAAIDAGLAEPYVQVRALGDFSVSYRVCGFLEDVKTLLSAQSLLHASVLDTLHGAGVEIVSPSYMNQRPVEAPVLPQTQRRSNAPTSTPESLMFDKADRAESLILLRRQLDEANAELKVLESRRHGADDDRLNRLEQETDALEVRIKTIQDEIERLESERDAEEDETRS